MARGRGRYGSGRERQEASPIGHDLFKMARRAWIIAGMVGFAAVLFQLFLRYEYISTGYWVMRVDRLTGTSCEMPCPQATVSPLTAMLPTPTPDTSYLAAMRELAAERLTSSRAIGLAENDPRAAAMWPFRAIGH